ncbi:MAG: hypothetical protein M1296_04725 [Chloroflexi bacterium]|nr:hypothetical protein [Chloroflexota bacterium]
MVLFPAKLAELRQHLDDLQHEFSTLQARAHPNLAGRLRVQLGGIAALQSGVSLVETSLAHYHAAANPALDTWRQLFSAMQALAHQVQALRIQQLPTYLASTPDDQYLSNLLEALHRDVGLTDVHPVASLHQPHWFAASAVPASHPLYFVPASLVDDPGELALAFHELGHVLFQLWFPDFGQRMQAAIAAAIQGKEQAIHSAADPSDRQSMTQALLEWRAQAFREMEEVVCDVVGTLLGGPAFVVTLAVGLLATSASPFQHHATDYPPLDCRMRLGGVVLRHLGLTDPLLDRVDASWAQVQQLYTAGRPRWYSWLYDDAYFRHIAAAVQEQLLARGVTLYSAGIGGIREQVNNGAVARMGDGQAYRSWARSRRPPRGGAGAGAPDGPAPGPRPTPGHPPHPPTPRSASLACRHSLIIAVPPVVATVPA